MQAQKVSEQDAQIQAALLDMAKAAGFTESEYTSIRTALANGATLADVFNISKDAMEAAYGYAYNLYNAGNYSDAETMFRGLCLYDGDDPRFWMGLAASLQARGEYQGAVDTYGMAGVAGGLQDPTPFYYAALCYVKLADAENAATALQAALQFGDDANAEHKACHERAQALLDTLQGK